MCYSLTKDCSVLLQNKLPPKLKDLEGCFIYCIICNLNSNKLLYDLGASINLMPYYVFKKLGYGRQNLLVSSCNWLIEQLNTLK